MLFTEQSAPFDNPEFHIALFFTDESAIKFVILYSILRLIGQKCYTN